MRPFAFNWLSLKSQLWRMLPALAVLGLLMLSACPQKAAPGSDAAQPAAEVKVDVTADTDKESAPATGSADAEDPAAGDKTADADAAADKAADEDKPAIPEQPVEIDEEKDIQRGEAKTPEPKGYWVDVDFMHAGWNEDPEAKLSHLLFTIGADLGRNDSVSAEIKLDEPDQEVFGELDLRICKVRVYPYVGPARVTRESGSKQEYTRQGRYVFMLLDNAGKGLGILEMDYDGEFQPAPPEKQPETTNILPVFNEDHAHIGYDITQRVSKDKMVEKILQIRINKGAFVTQQVTDPLGNVYVYRFPEIHLLVAPPEVDTSKPQRMM